MKKFTKLLVLLPFIFYLASCVRTPYLRSELVITNNEFVYYIDETFEIEYEILNKKEDEELIVEINEKDGIISYDETKKIFSTNKIGNTNIRLSTTNSSSIKTINITVSIPFEYTRTTNGIVLDKYVGKSVDTLIIPSKGGLNNSEPIYALGNGIFSKKILGDITIKHIELPDSLTVIYDNVFLDNDSIESLTISESSKLEHIYSYAFYNASKLKSLYLPYRVNMIGSQAFTKSGITSINSNTKSYQWIDGMLIDYTNNTNKYNIIYVDPNLTEVKFPNDVWYLSESLFEGNKNIKIIDFNRVRYIGANVFTDSSLETIFNTENILSVSLSSFSNTPWLINNEENTIIMGNNLLKYESTSKEVVIEEGIVTIASLVFANNTYESIILPKTLKNVGTYAFINNPNLEYILFQSETITYLGTDPFDVHTKLYTRETEVFRYNQLFGNREDFSNTFETYSVTISFYDTDNNFINSKEYDYYSKMYSIPTLPVIDNKEIIGWFLEDGTQLVTNEILDKYKDFKVTATYK